MSNDQKKSRPFVTKAAETGRAMVPTAVEIGAGIFGPIGGIAGAAAHAAIESLIQRSEADFVDRQLSALQRARTERLLELARKRIGEKLGLGYEVRSDDFFVKLLGGRSLADELLEGLLLAAQQEHEEKKLPYIANLFATIVHDSDIDRVQANLLIRLASSLSFTQFCLVGLFGRDVATGPRQDLCETFEEESVTDYIYTLLLEIDDLVRRHMLALRTDQSEEGYLIPMDLELIQPANMVTFGLGDVFYSSLELWRIPDAELGQIIEAMK